MADDAQAVRPVRTVQIDGQTWYALTDVCRRIGAARQHWLYQLPEDQCQVLPAGSLPKAKWDKIKVSPVAIDRRALYRIIIETRSDEAKAIAALIFEELAHVTGLDRTVIEQVNRIDRRKRTPLNQRVTADQVREWQKLSDEGWSSRQIAARYGCSAQSVTISLNPEKAPGHIRRDVYGEKNVMTNRAERHDVSADDVRQWLALRKEGRTCKEIAREAGRHYNVIYDYTNPKRCPAHIAREVFGLGYDEH
jgi:transposase